MGGISLLHSIVHAGNFHFSCSEREKGQVQRICDQRLGCDPGNSDNYIQRDGSSLATILLFDICNSDLCSCRNSISHFFVVRKKILALWSVTCQ